MEPSTDPPKPEDRRPTAVIQVGTYKLQGPWAAVVLIACLLLAIGLIAYFKPWIHPSPLWASAALWILFIGNWSTAAKKSAPTRDSESRASRRVHERLQNAALLLLFIPIPGLRFRFVPDTASIVLAGLAVHLLSFLLALWSRRHLGRNWSGAITIKVDHQLIRTGPYRLIRHPIYTGMLGMYVGTALVSGQLHALMAVVLIAAH